MSKVRLTIALTLLITLVGLLIRYPAVGRAHAEYDRSEPPANAVIPAAPPEVHVWFSQELFRRAGANSLAVFGPAGTPVDNGDARIDDDDRTHLRVSLPTGLPAGLYTVKWHTLSVEDGHEGSGEFSFTVDPNTSSSETSPAATLTGETPQPAANPTLAPAPTPDSGSSLPCLGGLMVGALLVVLPWWRQRGNP
jgi:methionine-rich copper-binding protein CopC